MYTKKGSKDTFNLVLEPKELQESVVLWNYE